jgi:hypothetical protein
MSIKRSLYNWMMDGQISIDVYQNAIRSGKISEVEARHLLLEKNKIIMYSLIDSNYLDLII